MSSKKYRVRLESLKLPAKPDFHEIVLKLNGKKLFPLNTKYHKIETETIIPLNLDLEIDHSHRPLLIELWEFRYWLPDDYIGLFKLEPLREDVKTETEMANNTFSVRITLTWTASEIKKAEHMEAVKQMA
jgi:hypothetical protein